MGDYSLIVKYEDLVSTNVRQLVLSPLTKLYSRFSTQEFINRVFSVVCSTDSNDKLVDLLLRGKFDLQVCFSTERNPEMYIWKQKTLIGVLNNGQYINTPATYQAFWKEVERRIDMFN